MKKIIIAVFIVIATLGIAAGTTTKKSTSTPKKEVTDPYVGWWYYTGNEIFFGEFDLMLNITKENGKYYITQYVDFPKTKGAKLCKNWDGLKFEITVDELKVAKTYNKRATKEQVERLKYNMENGIWLSKETCDASN